MRSVLSISLPPDMLKKIKAAAKKKGMSVSAYVVYLYRLEEELITEDEVLAAGKEALKAYKEGKTKVLHSFKDLM